MKRLFTRMMAVLAVAAVAACGSTGGGGPPPVEVRTGMIEQINATEVKSTHDQGLGAIIGGVAGAGLGSLIGAGHEAGVVPAA